jgi:CRP/FNR family transcriptional regulator, cyclic AMP receptor protein
MTLSSMHLPATRASRIVEHITLNRRIEAREAHHIQNRTFQANFDWVPVQSQWQGIRVSTVARAAKKQVQGTAEAMGHVRNGREMTMADTQFLVEELAKPKQAVKPSPLGCAACANRRPGWFCSLGSAVLADLELATSTIALPAEAALFTQGEDARCLYLICTGYLKLTAGKADDRHMIVRVAGPGSIIGLYAVLSHGVYEVTAESLTAAQLRPVERERFLSFLRNHKEAQLRAVQCICQEYRFALQDACRIALAETVAARLARLLIELAHQIGEHTEDGKYHFPLLLTHEEMASMTCTTRETVTRTLGQFRKEGSITIEDSVVTLHDTNRLQSLM